MSHQCPTTNDYDFWDEYSLWLEAQGLHDKEAPITEGEEEWIGHPDEWSSGNVPEPPANWEGEYWEVLGG